MTDTLEATETTEQTTLDTAQASPPADDLPARSEVSTPADATSGGGTEDADVSSGIDEGLAELARSYDLDPDLFPTQEALEKAVTHFDRLYSHQAKQQLWPTPAPQSQPAPATQTPTTPPSKRPEFTLKPLSKDQFDPELVAQHEAMASHLKQLDEYYQTQLDAYEKRFTEFQPLVEKFAQIEQYVQQQAQEQQRQAQEQYVTQMDAAFEKLGPEWSDLFGTGPIRDMKAHSLHAAKRMELDHELAAIRLADSQMGRRQTFEQQFQRALRSAFGDQLPTIERRKLAKAAHARRNGALSRPAAKTGKPLDPEQAVIAKVEEWASRVS